MSNNGIFGGPCVSGVCGLGSALQQGPGRAVKDGSLGGPMQQGPGRAVQDGVLGATVVRRPQLMGLGAFHDVPRESIQPDYAPIAGMGSTVIRQPQLMGPMQTGPGRAFEDGSLGRQSRPSRRRPSRRSSEWTTARVSGLLNAAKALKSRMHAEFKQICLGANMRNPQFWGPGGRGGGLCDEYWLNSRYPGGWSSAFSNAIRAGNYDSARSIYNQAYRQWFQARRAAGL